MPRTLAFLGLGTTLGYLVQTVYQLPALKRAGARLRWVWDLNEPAVRRVARLSTWTFASVATNQVALFVVLILAAKVDGGVSSWSAAFLFFSLPYAILSVSVTRALQPDLSAAWGRADVGRFRDQLSEGLRLVLALLLPASVAFAVLARPIVEVFLQHGHLSHDQAVRTGDTLALFALGLPGYSAFLLLISAFQAMQDTKTMFWLYVAENGANIVIALAVFGALAIPGLALAYSIAYTIAAFAAFAAMRQRTGGLDGRRVTALVGKSALVAAATGLAMALLVSVIGRNGTDHVVAGAVVALAAGATVSVIAARALRIDELTMLVGRLRRMRA